MNSTEKVFNRFFRPYICDLVWYITLFSQTIILFFAGFIYGDAPIDIKFTCEIPSMVYEYEVGDTVEYKITYKNTSKSVEKDVQLLELLDQRIN